MKNKIIHITEIRRIKNNKIVDKFTVDFYVNIRKLSNMIDKSLIKMKTHYSKHEYQKVMDIYKEMIDDYNKTFEKYGCNE